MKYTKDMVFHKLRAGTTIQDVPLDHPVIQMVLSRPRNMAWMNRVKKIINSPDTYDIYRPAYYCKSCGQIEGGARRIMALKMIGKKTCNIKIYRECIDA